MGLKKLALSFCLLWIGIGFIVLGLNAIISFNLPLGSFPFYVGTLLTFIGLFLIVIGVCYVITEFMP
jgi:hypothetical protein